MAIAWIQSHIYFNKLGGGAVFGGCIPRVRLWLGWTYGSTAPDLTFRIPQLIQPFGERLHVGCGPTLDRSHKRLRIH